MGTVMASIGPNSLVECVKPCHWEGVRLYVGSVYQVARVVGPGPGTVWICFRCGDVGDALEIVGKPTPEGVAWCACCFRPWPPEVTDEAVARVMAEDGKVYAPGELEPAALAEFQATQAARQAAYEARRRHHRADYPPVSREDIAEAERRLTDGNA